MKVCHECKRVDYFAGKKDIICSIDGTKLEPLVQLQNRYQLGKLLGEGGMGRVYQASDNEDGRSYAIKIIYPTDSQEDTQEETQEKSFTKRIKMFQREFETAASLSHPNIVEVYDLSVTTYGLHFIVMEYIKGENLHNILEKERTLPLELVKLILKQCVDALGEAHKKGILHRDLKPNNIMLTNESNRKQVKIVDFGLAKNFVANQNQTTEGRFLGTPLYSSPEQVRRQEVDQRSDIYSLALVVYKSLTGELPFTTDTSRLIEDPIPPSKSNPNVFIPIEIDKAILRALEKDPQKRTPSVEEFWADFIRDPMIGRIISDKYIIEKQLGSGKTARVYEGQHILLARKVAIKVFPENTANDKYLIQKATICARIDHPNTVTIYDFGLLEEGKAYMVMEFITGFSLRQLLSKQQIKNAQINDWGSTPINRGQMK